MFEFDDCLDAFNEENVIQTKPTDDRESRDQSLITGNMDYK